MQNVPGGAKAVPEKLDLVLLRLNASEFLIGQNEVEKNQARVKLVLRAFATRGWYPAESGPPSPQKHLVRTPSLTREHRRRKK
jgi:hypothetical protein